MTTLSAFSYVDNRVAFEVVVYNERNEIVGRKIMTGARYIAKIISEGNSMKFIGQANGFVTFSLKELLAIATPRPPPPTDPAIPYIDIANADDQPRPPDDLWYVTLSGGNPQYPILRCNGLSYWGMCISSFIYEVRT